MHRNVPKLLISKVFPRNVWNRKQINYLIIFKALNKINKF